MNTMLIMLSVPVFEGLIFWVLLRNPKSIVGSVDSKTTSMAASTAQITDSQTTVDVSKDDLDDEEKPLYGVVNKLRYMPSLFKYMIPLSLVYLFEYFINQGLVRLSHPSHYKTISLISIHINNSKFSLISV